MVRLARPEDRAALVALWGQVFGDGPADVHHYLDDFAGPGNVYVYEAGGAPVAQLLAVPCAAGAERGAYFFALATHPAHRGRGLMGEMMRVVSARLCEKGAAFTALIPASASLFEYYRARGFTHTLELRRLSGRVDELLPTTQEVPPARPTQEMPLVLEALTPGRFAALRDAFCDVKPISFAGERLAVALEDAAQLGAGLAYTGSAYAVYLVRGDTLAVAELFARWDGAALSLLRALAQKTGCGRYHVTLAAESALLAGRGTPYPSAMAAPLAPGFGARGLYLRFGGDTLFDKDYETV